MPLRILTRSSRNGGFTLVELMVTLAMAAILAMLAAPAIGDFIVKGKMTNTANEFSGSVLRARNEAVSRNICVTLCMSSSAAGNAPACTTSGSDWQVGWIGFLNTTCDSNLSTPASSTDIIFARVTSGSDITLVAKGSTPVKKMMFDSRGAQGLANASQFDVLHQSTDYTTKYGTNICIDALGRFRVIPGDRDCNQF